MGVYEDRVLPHFVEWTLGNAQIGRLRAKAMAGLAGEVVEIGFGSGLNVAHYPDEVEVVYAVEPSARAREIAEPRVERSSVRVEHVGLRGETIPLDDASCDHALSTFTLCTIPDVDAALAEVFRVLRPGGTLRILEHGLSPSPRMAKTQRTIEPAQKKLAGGCHLTREPLALLEAAGFVEVTGTEQYAGAATPWSWFTMGSGRKPR